MRIETIASLLKMLSEEVKSINDLLDSLRTGKISGTVQIDLDNKGKVNKILVRRAASSEKEKIEDEINKVRLKKNALRNANFANMNVSGSDFSGVDLGGSNFSYSNIVGSDLSGADLSNANFYKARISQTDMSNSYGRPDMSATYLTGSVNLYNVEAATQSSISNPYDEEATHHAEMPDDMQDISRILIHKRNY